MINKICLLFDENMLDNLEFISCNSEKNIELKNAGHLEKVENFLASTIAESALPSPGFGLGRNPLI